MVALRVRLVGHRRRDATAEDTAAGEGALGGLHAGVAVNAHGLECRDKER